MFAHIILLGVLSATGQGSASSGTADRIAPGELLLDLENRPIVGPSIKDHKAICLMFLGVDCPVSNAMSPEIVRIVKDFGGRGVVFAGVYPDPDIDAAKAREHEKDYKLGIPRILDPKQSLARQAQIGITPEAAILDPSGKVLWRGRINDLWTPEGKKRLAAQTHDLRQALEAVLAGKPPPPARGKAYGCPLPERNGAGS